MYSLQSLSRRATNSPEVVESKNPASKWKIMSNNSSCNSCAVFPTNHKKPIMFSKMEYPLEYSTAHVSVKLMMCSYHILTVNRVGPFPNIKRMNHPNIWSIMIHKLTNKVPTRAPLDPNCTAVWTNILHLVKESSTIVDKEDVLRDSAFSSSLFYFSFLNKGNSSLSPSLVLLRTILGFSVGGYLFFELEYSCWISDGCSNP